MPRLDRGIQYAAASRLNQDGVWNIGLPAFAGDDGVVWGDHLAHSHSHQSNDQISCEPQEFLIRGAVAFFAPASYDDNNLNRHRRASHHGGSRRSRRHRLRRPCSAIPIGATGARLIVTLLHALEAQNLKRDVAALCIGGGEATAIAVERLAH